MDTGQQTLGTNMYMYCLNDPVNMIDPDGYTSITGTAPHGPTPLGRPGNHPLQVITKVVVINAVRRGAVAGAQAAAGTAVVGTVGVTYVGLDMAGQQARARRHEYRAARNLMDLASTTASPPPPGRQHQTSSYTLMNRTHAGRNNFRIDLENPNPGQRPGQIHLQQGGNKYYYNHQTQQFHIGSSSGNLAPNSVQQLLDDPEVIRAIGRGLTMLGFG